MKHKTENKKMEKDFRTKKGAASHLGQPRANMW
jgi:hypothetical protein